MKEIKNSLIYLLAIVGVCMMIYVGWSFYQRSVAERQSRAAFSAPPSKGVPDFSHNAPPPPQP